MWASWPGLVLATVVREEFSLVDSINQVGELRFTDIGSPLEWDGNLDEITAPSAPGSLTISVDVFETVTLRIKEWENKISRTAVDPDPSFRGYEWEMCAKDDETMIAKIKVDPADKVEMEFDPILDEVTFVGAFSGVVFTWDGWVKFNELIRRTLDIWQFSRL